ncbi:MAG: hypothetical protein NC453_18475 [Muribaculum sp.]|nr:hypothetical protein [Muribaculum sp.]
MVEDIYNPHDEYVNVFMPRFKEVATETFAELADEAQIDIETNRQTCTKIYDTEKILTDVKSKIDIWTAVCVVLWLVVIVGSVSAYKTLDEDLWIPGLIGVGVVASLIVLINPVHPKLKALKIERDNLSATINDLKKDAWNQMAPLNRLYDWDILTRMMSRTVPRLEFDPYFTTQRLADLKEVYGWDDSFNKKRSVIFSHSGLINGNPFVLCRTRKMEWGQKTYEGTKTIYWEELEKGSDGKYHTVKKSQVLHAYVTKPFPEYYEKTRLIYGNTAAPDLTFTRKKSGLANKEKSLSFKWKKYRLQRKSRNLKDNDYAMMTNEEFEVAFDTSDRNNNQQYALLFTSLAQNNMMELLSDDEVGYGDNFDIEKNHMINIVIPDHIQTMNLDMNPQQYHHFDYDKAEMSFYEINAKCFHAIYFSLAPLLCVPMYQQIRSHKDIYGIDMKTESAFWEHEALANFWGQDKFKSPDCVTDCIIKTEQEKGEDDSSVITVHAHGYRAEERVTYVTKRGNDGYDHEVPVHWYEYLPVVGTGNIFMKEDNDFDDGSVTHRQRLDHIENVLTKASLNLYRRHIASTINQHN